MYVEYRVTTVLVLTLSCNASCGKSFFKCVIHVYTYTVHTFMCVIVYLYFGFCAEYYLYIFCLIRGVYSTPRITLYICMYIRMVWYGMVWYDTIWFAQTGRLARRLYSQTCLVVQFKRTGRDGTGREGKGREIQFALFLKKKIYPHLATKKTISICIIFKLSSLDHHLSAMTMQPDYGKYG